MKAAEYLERIRQLDEKINRKTRMAERWRQMAYSVPANTTKPHYGGTRATSASFERCIEKADVLEKEITADIDSFIDLKLEAEEKIGMIPDETCQEILRLRYLDLLKWHDVEAAVNMSHTHVFRKHREALVQLEEII